MDETAFEMLLSRHSLTAHRFWTEELAGIYPYYPNAKHLLENMALLTLFRCRLQYAPARFQTEKQVSDLVLSEAIGISEETTPTLRATFDNNHFSKNQHKFSYEKCTF